MKKTKRSKAKYPSLNPRLNSRVRQETLDYDYLHKLNEEELAWLDKFTSEYNNASLILDDEGNVIPEENIHKTNHHKKSIYDANNARNRDQYGLTANKVGRTNIINFEKAINIVEEYINKERNPLDMENSYLDFIESKQLDEMIQEYNNAMLLFRDHE